MHATLFNTVDLAVAPAIFLVLLAYIFIKRKKQPAPVQKYFVPAFLLRVLGTVSLSAIVEFYYANGDTYQYYYNAQMLRDVFFRSPWTWLKIMFQHPLSSTPEMTQYLDKANDFSRLTGAVFENQGNATASKIASFFNLICFNSSLGIALFFGLLSFLGCWYIYKTFTHIFPGYEKQFAWLCLFLPSLWFWGSGILKDPICIFALGLLFYNVFVKRSFFLKRILLILLACLLLIWIKPYIFYGFAAAVFTGYCITAFKRSNIIAKLAIIVFFATAVAVALPFLSSMVQDSFDELMSQSKSYMVEYNRITVEGDGNFIPELDPTPAGFAKLAFQGLFTVYLRPFPWELKKVLYIFLILENLLIYYIIFKKIKKGPLIFAKNFRSITNFSLAFFVFMGIIVGVTAFNFGTIARYRVPALPFLFAGIFAWKLSKRKLRDEKLSLLTLDKM